MSRITAKNIIQILDDSQKTSREQVNAVAHQLMAKFKNKMELNEFRPFTEAMQMLDKSKHASHGIVMIVREDVFFKLYFIMNLSAEWRMKCAFDLACLLHNGAV